MSTYLRRELDIDWIGGKVDHRAVTSNVEDSITVIRSHLRKNFRVST